MALVIADRVRETTTTTGTGTITLAGPYTGFQPFSVIGNGNTTYYAIIDATTGAWEVGIGTYTSSGNTLSRDTLLASSTGSAISFAAGTKDVIITQPAERAVYVVGTSVVAANSATVPNSLLANSAITIGGTSISLGGSSNALANDITIYGITVGRGAGAMSTNTAVGASALAAGTASSNNTTAIGYNALLVATAGSNLAVGSNALVANTTGDDNTAIGSYAALAANTTGTKNIAVGRQALASNTTASNNTAVGYQAGYLNTAGAIVAIGAQALYNNTAAYNVAIGQTAGYSTTSGARNSFVGTSVGYSNTTGNYNIALGNYDGGGAATFGNNTTGSNNVAIGSAALQANTTASNNTAVGYSALFYNTTASGNTAVGYQASYNSVADGYNTAIGYQAGYSNVRSAYNVFVGQGAGYYFNTAASSNGFNTFIGQASGDQITTGTKNSILGRYNGNQGGLDIRTASNYIVLSDGDGNPRMFVDGSGRANIGGTSATAGKLVVDTSGAYYSTDFATALFRDAWARATVRVRSLADDSAEVAYDVNGALRWMWSARPSGSSAVGYDMNLYRQASTPNYTSVNSEIITFQQNGNIILPFGQLQFPATQNPSSNANTLDDYEEGTFTPTVGDADSGGNEASYTSTTGNYTKVGNIVRCQIRIQLASKGSMASGNAVWIRGLPFVSASNNVNRSLSILHTDYTTFSSGYVTAVLGANTSSFTPTVVKSGVTASPLAVSDIGSGWFVITEMVYQV